MSTVKVNAGAVFERHEKKYLLEAWQYEALTHVLADRMTADDTDGIPSVPSTTIPATMR